MTSLANKPLRPWLCLPCAASAARLLAKQLKIEREDLEKKYRLARNRMAALKRSVRKKWKKMREEFEFIGTMT